PSNSARSDETLRADSAVPSPAARACRRVTCIATLQKCSHALESPCRQARCFDLDQIEGHSATLGTLLSRCSTALGRMPAKWTPVRQQGICAKQKCYSGCTLAITESAAPVGAFAETRDVPPRPP